MERAFVGVMVVQVLAILALIGAVWYLLTTMVANFDLNLAAHNLGEAVAAFRQAAGR